MGASLNSYFQVSPEMFNRVQVRALAGPLKDIQRLVLKPFLRCLRCVLRVVVLLEGESSPQSEVLNALEQVFIKDLSTSAQHDAATAMVHHSDGARFPPDVTLGIQEINLGFIRPEILVSHGLRIL